MPIINIGTQKFGADNIVFGTGSETVTDPITGAQTTIAQLNASHIPFLTQGTAVIDDLINGSKTLSLTVGSIELPAAAAGLVKNNASGDILLGGALAVSDIPSDIPATRIYSGQVTNTAFAFVANLTSDAQAQLDALAFNAPSISYFFNLKDIVTSDTADTVTADIAYLLNAGGQAIAIKNVSNSISTAVSGAGGLDSGVIATNTFYARYLIYNPTTATTSGLISTSATAPTLPAGYTFYTRTGWIRTDSASKLMRTLQYNNRTVHVNTGTGLPLVASGASGSVSVPTWVALSVTGFVPSTAREIVLLVGNTANAGGSIVIVAPNNQYGSNASTTNPPPINFYAIPAATEIQSLVLESNNIYWANYSGFEKLWCYGWVE